MRLILPLAFFTASHLAGMARTSQSVVVDWGLHRQWIVQCDEAHPERPARLKEVPWSESRSDKPTGESTQPSLAIRIGAVVTLASQRADGGEIHLVGTALEPGNIGDTIRVRAGLHGATLLGIVRGAGVVELAPAGGRK